MTLPEILKPNPYPGRGIAVAKIGSFAIAAYFIMGRSENSRNRIFLEDKDGVTVKAFDDSKVTDPSLIIYDSVKVLDNATIITNGDQTNTIFDYLSRGYSFGRALSTRTFEPDAPHFTPRISAVTYTGDGEFHYAMSIIKSDGNGGGVRRYLFNYEEPQNGIGHFIHTYSGEFNDILQSFQGEPNEFELPECDIDDFTSAVWAALNSEKRVSLFTRFIDVNTGTYESRIINQNVRTI